MDEPSLEALRDGLEALSEALSTLKPPAKGGPDADSEE
jgi:hypothetical protein